jgi:glyoxalase family protein
MSAGIHHITAIASDAIQTVKFYSQVLGLRLVKKTVNQDDPKTYHLFFGDKLGHPGMDLTFFIFLPSMAGRHGNGMVTTISLAVAASALPFWQRRFEEFAIKYEPIAERFGKPRLLFFDSDGQSLELVGIKDTELETSDEVWSTRAVEREHAIHSFHSATLSVISLDDIEPVLSHVFGYEQVAHAGQSFVYTIPSSHRAAYLEVNEQPSADFGINGAGTVHHIAFRAKNETEQQDMRDRVVELGLYPTETIDRFYFKSVYFRTPAGILCEIATDGPGFTADESESELGQELALPPFLAPHRQAIEAQLPPLPVYE